MKANSEIPPLHPPVPPHCKVLGIQLTNYYVDSVFKEPELIAAWLSIVATEANAQQDPHLP